MRIHPVCITFFYNFRFAGDEYPPFIVFKVYTHLTDGNSAKYLNGKNMIKPFSIVNMMISKILKRSFFHTNTSPHLRKFHLKRTNEKKYPLK
jgi:hypothetical protein